MDLMGWNGLIFSVAVFGFHLRRPGAGEFGQDAIRRAKAVGYPEYTCSLMGFRNPRP
jgi:hypothetical protein